MAIPPVPKETGRARRPPAAKPMRILHGLAREMQEIQRAAQDATKDARRDQQLRGRRLTVALNGGSDQVVSHGLGRKPVSVAMRNNPQSVIYTVGGFTSKTITFSSSAPAGTVEFWVY
jgi:hypothetical protein